MLFKVGFGVWRLRHLLDLEGQRGAARKLVGASSTLFLS